MKPFQIVILPLIAIVLLRTMYVALTQRSQRRMACVASVIWVAAGAAVMWPDITVQVAHLLGIGRGTDLLVYMLVLAFLLFVGRWHFRMTQLESALTQIVRQLALRDAEQNRDKEDTQTHHITQR